MSRLGMEELEALVRPSGQYRQKARKLRAFVDLLEARGGLEGVLSLPAEELRKALLGTWGIGEETADCMVVYAAKSPAFVVDAYTKRLFGRLGLGPGEEAGYGAWQRYFVEGVSAEEGVPADAVEFWGRYHALIVLHSKYVCLKRSPRCEGCGLRGLCPGVGA
jgi:endonuclease III related protein